MLLLIDDLKIVFLLFSYSIRMERGNEFKAYFTNILVRGPSNFRIEKLR